MQNSQELSTSCLKSLSAAIKCFPTSIVRDTKSGESYNKTSVTLILAAFKDSSFFPENPPFFLFFSVGLRYTFLMLMFFF